MTGQGPAVPLIPASNFPLLFVTLNGLDTVGFEKWVFRPGMLYGASEEWWGAKKQRVTPHEGLDLCLYAHREGRILPLGEKCKVPVAYDGTVVAMLDDYIGTTIIVTHHFGHSDKRSFCTIYGHIVPSPGLSVGDAVNEGEVIARTAPVRDRASGVLPHLHLTVGWASGQVPPCDLTWKDIGDPGVFTLLDPLAAMDWGGRFAIGPMA